MDLLRPGFLPPLLAFFPRTFDTQTLSRAHHVPSYGLVSFSSVFLSLPSMGNRSGLHSYFHGSIYSPSSTKKHDILILIRYHWARLVQGHLAAMNMVSG